MGTTYSEEFKQAALKKILERGSRSLDAVTEELGISSSAAYSWMKQSGMMPGMVAKKEKKSGDWSAPEKFRAVMEFERLREDPLSQGEYLRTQGLYGKTVEGWEAEILGALEKQGRKPKRAPEEIVKDERIAALERDLRRKDRALAETTALLVLKKKAELIWGLVDDEEGA